jgi:5-methylcytosine-specific restriction endonuclease McrA
MKTKKPSAERVWKQFEDLAPRLRLSPTDRVVYSHLFRHSRLEGKPRLRFSIPWLARGVGLTHNPVRWSVRRLIARGVLRLVERSKEGHVVEVRLPEEFPAGCPAPIPTRPLIPTRDDTFEELDFFKHRDRRRAIHVRERGRCFYCRRRLTSQMRSLDHVVPRVDVEDNSYRNLVSCCLECNSLKRGRPAPDFLRWLRSERRLTAVELASGLRALDALVAGKLRPPL